MKAVAAVEVPGRAPLDNASRRFFAVAHCATALTVAAIAWGALAFGAVYPWGYRVLAGLAFVAGVTSLFASHARPEAERRFEHGRRSPSVGFVFGLAAVCLAIAAQLIPMPLRALTLLSPRALTAIRQIDLAFTIAPAAHALSVWPSGTATALFLFVSFSTLLLGTAVLTSVVGSRFLVELLTITGVILALIGIVQQPLYAGKIYGFWVSLEGGTAFGPFINRNHFAGWMLMALPLALGYLCASMARAMRGLRTDWNSRLHWLSSPDANKLMLTAAAIVMMAVAVVLTFSRSGIIALSLSLAATVWLALRRLQGGSRKIVVVSYLAGLVAVLVLAAGPDRVIHRFSDSNQIELDARTGAWIDAAATFKRYWLTGTGLNTYQIVNVLYQQHDSEHFANAAHNDYLQLAAEGGVLMMIAVGSCLIILLRDVRRRFREDGHSSTYWIRAGAVTALLAIALQETVDFSLQIPANAALFAVVCGIALHQAPKRRAA